LNSCLNLSNCAESDDSDESFTSDEQQDEFKTSDSDIIDEDMGETQTKLMNIIKKKLKIKNGTNLSETDEKFVDTELIKKLLLVFLNENKVTKTSFTKYILKININRFGNRLRGNTNWKNRTPTVKWFFNKIKKILNFNEYSRRMIAVESEIYEQRMQTLMNILGFSDDSFESFANKHLKISLSKFKTLRYHCLQKIPLDDVSKENMNIITEFIGDEQMALRQKFATYERRIKGKLYKFIQFSIYSD
jgi:hypothetical protein